MGQTADTPQKGEMIMNYREVMDAFSCCGIGMVLAAEDNTVLDFNEAGGKLLHVDANIRGRALEEAAPFLFHPDAPKVFGNPAFGQYLLPCPCPAFDGLPAGTRLFAFRDATMEFQCGLLENVLNRVSEAITLWDRQGRMLMLNDAAVKLEAHVSRDAVGRHVSTLYQARNDSILVIPQIIEKKKPLIGLRQDFVTHTGKELQIISNNYPILKNGEVVGAISMMDDYTKLEELNKQIIELQRKLVDQSKKPAAAKGNALPAKFHFNDIVCSSRIMRTAIGRCKQVARSDAPVMLYGETGTGKELFAQSIHNESPRANGPFLAVNCAAIPATLLESMLFGTEKGAYTGAEKREGLFEQADTGTLLLDEINSMDIALQSKLLRVLQEGTFRRVGGSKLIHVDVRVLSNINIPPLEAIEQELLRKDLYYRLGVINIKIPPLRERKEDILLLTQSFIRTKNRKLLKNATALSPAAAELLFAYDWPGNVRELQHAIEYALNIIPEEMDVIQPEFLPEHILQAVGGTAAPAAAACGTPTLESVMQEAGARFLQGALLEHGGNISQTAKALGITRQNLQHRMKKFGVHAVPTAEK